ncbi:hypothetical protein MNBD_UNCLBAC01-1088 [hydrothermal vent metagenome]|uniref:Uncharacterized protein n=1 Tax=hydrothermal vent metagenome TaxID=652676 RepID=A0A3B1CW39_9ZZZZ
MLIFGIIVGVSLLGIGCVFFLLYKEKNTGKSSVEKIDSDQIDTDIFDVLESEEDLPIKKSWKEGFNDIFGKVPFLKKKAPLHDIVAEKPLVNFEDALDKLDQEESLETGTASLKVAVKNRAVQNDIAGLSSESEKNVGQDLEVSIQLNELKEKCGRLEGLLGEKTTELEKVQKDFENELKNRNDFNKIKDVLEKELKEVKDKAKDLKNECNVLATEKGMIKKKDLQSVEQSFQNEGALESKPPVQ